MPSPVEPASRWLTLGAAAENGVLAARGAAEGLRRAPDLLEARGSKLAGVAVSGGLLLDELGRRFRFREVGLKPYPVARQALAAVEACRALARDSGAPDEIERITIAVPAAQRRILDHPERPGAPERRMASIVDVRYLAALAVLGPERLHHVGRSPPFTSAAIQKLASRVEVETAPELERYYPERWPARVEIRWKGRELSRELLTPAADVESAYSWDEALDKFWRALAPQDVGRADRGALAGPSKARCVAGLALPGASGSAHRRGDGQCRSRVRRFDEKPSSARAGLLPRLSPRRTCGPSIPERRVFSQLVESPAASRSHETVLGRDG